MNKEEFLTKEETEIAEETGLENLESNVEVKILDIETNSEKDKLTKDEIQGNWDKEITDEMVEGLIDENDEGKFAQDEITEYLRSHTIREHIYNNEKGKPYMRMLKTDLTTSFIPQRFENNQWITRN